MKLSSFFLSLLTLGAVGASMAVAALPSMAGTIIVNTPADDVQTQRRSSIAGPATVCRIDADGNTLNFFGPTTFITLTEIQGTSTFRYERPVAYTITSGFSPNTFASTDARTLTYANYDLGQARQRLANSPDDYARLLGLSEDNAIVRRGFTAVDRYLACGPLTSTAPVSIFQVSPNRSVSDLSRLSTNSITSVASRLPSNPLFYTERLTLVPEAFVPTAIAALPDGNYRLTTPSSVESAANGAGLSPTSPLFTFRKQGNLVTGNFAYPEDGLTACVTGTLQGNTVVGQAFTSSDGNFVLSENYLGPSLSLRLGTASGGDRYDDAVLDLNGFSRINAGEIAPPSSCQ